MERMVIIELLGMTRTLITTTFKRRLPLAERQSRMDMASSESESHRATGYQHPGVPVLVAGSTRTLRHVDQRSITAGLIATHSVRVMISASA